MMATHDPKERIGGSAKPGDGKSAASKTNPAGADRERATPEVEVAGSELARDPAGPEVNAQTGGIRPEDIIEAPEFKDELPPHTDAELAELEQLMLADGCRNPVVERTARNILHVGYTRLAICREHGLRIGRKAIRRCAENGNE